LPLVLPLATVEAFIALLQRAPGTQIGIDLAAQRVFGPDGEAHGFEIDPFRKECLLAGADDVTFTLALAEEIDAFEKAYQRRVPWL
jgi:3-isopropylmalate/(R)-2-methylmalate dehydratase small subunit